MSGLLLAVETGGTKIVARLVGDHLDCTARWRTTTPDQAVEDVIRFVAEHAAGHAVTGIGVAAFGPVVLEGDQAGLVLETSKPRWSGSNMTGMLAGRLGAPARIDTDVNAAAMAELARDRTDGVRSLAYVTVGTGIGAGFAMAHGNLHGALHPEFGHVRLVREVDDAAPSSCPFHADCAEGLAAGPSVLGRCGDHGDLAEHPKVQARVSRYLSQLLVTIVLAWSPHRIVLGGGVGASTGMLDTVRVDFLSALGGYGVGSRARLADFVRAPTIEHAGLEGALLLARRAAAEENDHDR